MRAEMRAEPGVRVPGHGTPAARCARFRARLGSAPGLAAALVIAVAAVVLGAAPAGASGPAAEGDPETVHIAITARGFEPQGQEVPVGTTVVWTNRTSAVHDVSATDGTFYSGDIRPGFTFTFVFTSGGEYAFRDSRTGAQGVITVGGPVAPPPTTPPVTTPTGPPPGQMAFTGAGDGWLAAGGALLAVLGILAVMATGAAPAPALVPFRSLPFPRIRRRYLSDLLPWRLSSRARRRPTRGFRPRTERSRRPHPPR